MRHVRYGTLMTPSLNVVTYSYYVVMAGKHYMEFHAHMESSQRAQALKVLQKY